MCQPLEFVRERHATLITDGSHTSRGLSKMLDILYSKFCDAARGLVRRRLHARPVSTQILVGIVSKP